MGNELSDLNLSFTEKNVISVQRSEEPPEEPASTDDKEESEEESVETVATEDEEVEQEPLFKEFPDPVKRYVTVNALNVRSGAGTNHSAITNVKIGQEVTAHGEQGGWTKVQVGEQTGWVSTNYLSESQPKVTVEKPEEQKEKSSSDQKENESEKESEPEEQPTNQTLADQLSTVDNNDQLILVTTNGYSTNQATIRTFVRDSNGNWQTVMEVGGFIGKNGFSNNKKEGDGKSPTGKYSLGTAFGQKGNPGTKLPYRGISSDDVWVDDPESPLYNTWQSKSETQDQWNSAENMNHRLYTNGFVINYNTSQTPYKGSAIFFHVGNSYTLGCVATPESNVVSIMQWIDPDKNPVIIQTPMEDLERY